MTQKLKKLYGKYFQKSKSFLYPLIGIKKDSIYAPIQSYMAWEGIFSITDQKLILTYYVRDDEKAWDSYLLNTIMKNKFFNEYHEIDEELLAVSFDLSLMSDDYQKVLFGQYSKLSKILKGRIREFYGYSSPEWAYMESFLFPDRYVPVYSRLLDVDESHIRHTGELCDKPNLDSETLKIKPYGKINDADSHKVESSEDFQADPHQS
jgi:hypothetical protein